MVIHTIEINGIGILAFDAENQSDAEQVSTHPQVSSNMMIYETKNGPIWNGRDKIIVREASPAERRRWQLAHTMRPTRRFIVWLVEVTNQDVRGKAN
jgi:hypothetical protein